MLKEKNKSISLDHKNKVLYFSCDEKDRLEHKVERMRMVC